MPDTEAIVQWLSGLPPAGLYATIFIAAYIENLFPPSPSDVILLFVATLIGIGTIGHVPAIGIATLGSVLGFLTAFMLGRRYGRGWVESNKVPFVSKDSLAKVDKWFEKYGYWVIVANRFLSGTRAVISFFAGMSRLEIVRTTVLCAVSALAWNILVLELGAFLGSNWRAGEEILSKYGLATTILLAAIALYFLIRWIIGRGKKKEEVAR